MCRYRSAILACLCVVLSSLTQTVYAQNYKCYSAINPALFSYCADDVHVRPPEKFNKGKHLWNPDPQKYPWEDRLENGMPNVIKNPDGGLTLYLSSFLIFSQTPPSKVGVMALTNTTSSIEYLTRAFDDLYWYNPKGTTADEKISSEFEPGFEITNIVATDVESMGVYLTEDETEPYPVKFAYLPQRESGNIYLGGYETLRATDDRGVLKGFTNFKDDRKTTQFLYRFKFINGDTHMNYLQYSGNYYLVSRLNAKRSYLQPGEKLPFSPDPRIMYRRETVSNLGKRLQSEDVGLNIALDMSDDKWEPYSMQPFRMKGFESDIWWGLVTMYGTTANPDVANRQRTELAYSNNGLQWTYVKPGTPFLDNGAEGSDDYGCINIAKPVSHTKFSTGDEWYYYYASSNQRHVEGRVTGVSLAVGKHGKLAGLKGESTHTSFYSANPTMDKDMTSTALPRVSLYNMLRLNSNPYPQILADVTEDPRGKEVQAMSSYVFVDMYSYDSSKKYGTGMLLGGSFGSSILGTETPSDNYESVCGTPSLNHQSQELIFNFLKSEAQLLDEPVSLKDYTDTRVVLQAGIKNGVLYGIRAGDDGRGNYSMNFNEASSYGNKKWWGLNFRDHMKVARLFDFSKYPREVNRFYPTCATAGSIAIRIMPVESDPEEDQVILRISGTDRNFAALYYTTKGEIMYKVIKDEIPFEEIVVAPPTGKTFSDKTVMVTLEAVNYDLRKYDRGNTEDVNVLHVSCPELGFDGASSQKILWDWKHETGQITDSDRANARAFAYVNYSSFVPNAQSLMVGAYDMTRKNQFTGSIFRLEMAVQLPGGSSDFYNADGDDSLDNTEPSEK